MTSFVPEPWAAALMQDIREQMLKNFQTWYPPLTDDERAEYAAARAAAQPRLHDALAELDALTGTERAVLDLHSRDSYGYCEGCDLGSWAESGADWPCRTVNLIADIHDIDLSDFHLYDPKWSPEGKAS